MENLLYSPYDLALIIQYHGMDYIRSSELLNDIFCYDNIFIEPIYRQNQKKFILDVMDKMNYINHQEQFDMEKSAIEQDLSDYGLINSISPDDNFNMAATHIIFKELRIRIQYISSNGYVRMKLRTLLSELGYKRRSQYIINYIIECLLFYHLSISLRNNAPCDIEKIGLDEMIIFRII